MKNILIATPVLHLPNVVDLIENIRESYAVNFLIKESLTKNEVREILVNQLIDIIICNPNQQEYIIDEELLTGTNVKYINTCSTGTNHIDVEYCNQNNIIIDSLTRDMELLKSLPSTAELAFGLLQAVNRNIVAAHNYTIKSKIFDYTSFIGGQLSGKTIAIIGMGRLGTMMSNYCKAFGMKVIAVEPYAEINDDQVDNMIFTDAIRQADFISIHVHVTPFTRDMFNKQIFLSCSKKPIIINTSRGEIVNETDLLFALEQGLISGYGTDVLSDEYSQTINNPLLEYAKSHPDKVVITPHIGGMTKEGQETAYSYSISKIISQL